MKSIFNLNREIKDRKSYLPDSEIALIGLFVLISIIIGGIFIIF